MGLCSKLASSNVLDYWSQELFEDGGLQIPKPMSQARNDNNSDGSSGKINDQVSAQIRKHWPPLRCPRCDSSNTKFCYYNNYSKSQPRHFCKACRRHWTEGGTLRNVPVGGGRKNKRAKNGAAGSSTAAASTTINGSAEGSSGPMIPLPPSSPHQQQQNKLSGLTLFGANQISNIFPEVLRQVLFHPPPPPQFQLSHSGNYNSIPGNNLSVIGFPPDLLISSLPYVSRDGLATSNGAWPQAGRPATVPSVSDGGGVPEQTHGPYWSGWDDDVTDFDATRASSAAL